MHLDIKISDLGFNSVIDHTHNLIMSMIYYAIKNQNKIL